MIQTFKNTPLKYKLITCFLLIISINAVSGLMGLEVMKELGKLVNMTYDKALMSGTFAQASKFDFSQGDIEFRSALLSEDEMSLKKSLRKVKRLEETLVEDLDVVKERTLSPKSSELIQGIRDEIKDIQEARDELILKKRLQLKIKAPIKDSVELVQSWNTNQNKVSLYRKLTALYDDAAIVGYEFRMSSESKNDKNLKRTFWILGASIFISIVLSLGISLLIINPLFSLQNICKKVSEGDYSIRTPVLAKDEFGTLASSFNDMLNTIQDKTENISSLLASLPFALFYFEKDGSISKERSQSTDLIFKRFSSYQTISDFFGDHKINTKHVEEITKAIFQNIMPFNSAVHLFPKTIEVQTESDLRIIQMSFKPKLIGKKIEKVIVIADDITDKIRAQEESKKLAERVERVSKISSDITGFKEFLPAVQKIYTSILLQTDKAEVTEINDFKRDLHTLKGLLGIYSFKSCATSIHEIESLIEKLNSQINLDVCEKLKASEKLFSFQTQDIISLLALNKESGLKYYNESKIKLICDQLIASGTSESKSLVQSIDRFPIEKVLAKYSTYAQNIVSKMEEKKIKIVFHESDEVSYEEVQRVDAALIHILNNSIDHGIENFHERIGLMKNELGVISFCCKRNTDQSLSIKISDDGKGINGEYLLLKAVRLGLVTEAEANTYSIEQKNNLIFATGLSSKETSSEVSGRGIGMDAVKAHIESLKGTIELDSKVGQGTIFSMHIPAFESLS